MVKILWSLTGAVLLGLLALIALILTVWLGAALLPGAWPYLVGMGLALVYYLTVFRLVPRLPGWLSGVLLAAPVVGAVWWLLAVSAVPA
jgi:hypothetical protein